MHSADLDQLRRIATQAGCTLVVRAPSRHAEAYFHRSGFVARPLGLDLPAATTNAGGKELRGLVVSHPIHPGVFAAQDRARAADAWSRLTGPGSRSGEAILAGPYSVELDVDSPYYGVVKHAGRFVHDGYELVAVAQSNGSAGLPGALLAAMLSAGSPPGAIASFAGSAGLTGRQFEEGLLAILASGEVRPARSAAEARGLLAAGGSR